MEHTKKLSRRICKYIETRQIGQGRHAGDLFRVLYWQRRFINGAFGQPDDAALTVARGNGKTTLCSGIMAAAVDVDGPLVEPMADCIMIASSFDQGTIAFRHLLHFLEPSLEKYKSRFRIQDSANRASMG